MTAAPVSGRHVLGSALTDALLAAGNAAGVGMTVSVQGADGRFETAYVNDAALAINGYSRDEFIELDPMSILAPGEAERLRGRSAAAVADGVAVRLDARIVRKSGEELPIALAIARVPWNDAGGGHAIVSFFFDASAEKHAVEALRKSEAKLRAFIESAPFGMALIQDETVIFANVTFIRLFGLSQHASIDGMRGSDIVPPEDWERVSERLRTSQNERRAAPPTEYRRKLDDGSDVIVEATTIPFEHEGRPAVLSFARDVTERRQLAEHMARVDRLVALGTLAAGVAHEINNPVAITGASLEALERLLRDPAPDVALRERALALIADARRGVTRVADIVGELRGFSRSDDERRAVDVAQVIGAAERMTERAVRDRARVAVVARPVPPVWANAGRLEQVFVNLLMNAAQAMPAGDVANNVIVVELDADGEDVVASVRDNGIGISPQHVERVFDPFFTTKPVGEGTGLGLAVSHTIVTQLGGTITVESELGKGSVFRVRLPATPVATSRVKTPLPRKAPRRARILIVDDEPTLVRTLMTLLGDEHDVVGATSGADALSMLLGGTSFDLVLCDLMMPYVTGMDLFERLARERPGLERRLVFMTGGAFTPRARAFLDEVPNVRLDKPFSPAMVNDLLDATLAS